MSGDVIVESAGVEVARRGPGDVVGEMSLITRSPRMASVVADGDVRAIKIDRRAFEGMVHDRPDVALGVMRVLAHRLAERSPFRLNRGAHGALSFDPMTGERRIVTMLFCDVVGSTAIAETPRSRRSGPRS